MIDRKLRRLKQQLPEHESIEILKRGQQCVWAVAGDDDFPYAVPVNYVYSDGAIYIHCARQGHKLDAITRNPKCSICVIDKDDVVPEKFTTYFKSVIAFGLAEIIEDRTLVIEALRHLSEKYSPGIDPTDEIAKFMKTVCIVKITPLQITGKEAIELTGMRQAPGSH